MAGSKSARARGGAGTASGKGSRSATSSGRNGSQTNAATRTAATRTSTRGGAGQGGPGGKGGSGTATRDRRGGAGTRTGSGRDARDAQARLEAERLAQAPPAAAGPPLWLQLTTFVLALAGLGVSIYETYAHFNGSHLAGCTGTGAENCTKVITSPQSMVFGVIPVAILGLIFYVLVVAIMSPWAWRMARREVAWLRLAAMVTGVGFVVYLLYAELFQIGSICLYCTSVHVITFVLFAFTIFATAIWGIGSTGAKKPA